MSGPTGRLVLEPPDDFYLMTHDSHSGSPLVHPMWIGLGLAACLVAELMIAGDAWINDGLLTAVDTRAAAPPEFEGEARVPAVVPLRRRCWDAIVAERHRHPVSSWLAMWSEDAEGDVAERLIVSGHLRSRRSEKAWPAPVSWAAAEQSVTRLRHHIQFPPSAGPPRTDDVLLSLVDAVGLSPWLLDGASPNAVAHHAARLANLAAECPWFAELAGHLRTAVAAGVLTRH